MDSSPRSPSLPVAPVAGVKRPAPSLLPAFEPFSSSPCLPRPAKRLARVSYSQHDDEKPKYPTPIATSSTGMMPSSPPPLQSTRRPALVRTLSTFSERTPLSTVPSIELDKHGEPTLMGRSSNSSHYQLSTNKLISRVHVRAVYTVPSPPAPKKILVECLGWNGVKVHCQGMVWELRKGDSFTSETEDADVMIDVQDARVLLRWPRRENRVTTPVDSDSPWDEENSPTRNGAATRSSAYQSPLRRRHRLQSPVSPSPAVQVSSTSSSAFFTGPPVIASVQVYEDERSEDEAEPTAVVPAGATQSTQQLSQVLDASLEESQSSVSAAADAQNFSDRDEENDPVVHALGPFGSNVVPRMESFSTRSPARRPLKPLKEVSVTPPKHRSSSESTREDTTNPIINHVINQLAFSRLSSTPLSTLMDHLPSHLKSDSPGAKENKRLTVAMLKTMLDSTRCIGKVEREGKDAAGKRLESEYHYVPDFDEDLKRRDAVVEGLGKPGLRACRKQHKVCLFGVFSRRRVQGECPLTRRLATAILLAETEQAINLLFLRNSTPINKAFFSPFLAVFISFPSPLPILPSHSSQSRILFIIEGQPPIFLLRKHSHD